jgi:hypothetical protein
VRHRGALFLVALLLGRAAGAAPSNGDWRFQVLLDGKPIGEHRFTLTTPIGDGTQRTLVSDAAFAVRFLGVTVYRYRHHATESWRGDCLASLDAATDDDGKALAVQSRQDGESYRISVPNGVARATGCVMSYAYWNPALRTQTRLLNAQTGAIDAVRIERVDGAGKNSPPVGAPAADATRLRITGGGRTVDVWLGPDGDWLGLDATVAGGRQLAYRLPSSFPISPMQVHP